MKTRSAKASAALWDQVAEAIDELPMAPAGTAPIARRRRRGYEPLQDDGRAELTLLRDDEDVLRWIYTAPQSGLGARRRSYRSLHVADHNVVRRFRFNERGSNDITRGLVALDAWLTPGQGLKRWVGDRFIDDPRPQIRSGRVLLLVHGTFSRSEMWAEELTATPEGQAMLRQWGARYSAILAFSHPTLSVGAWSNAIDLDRAMAQVQVPVDVVSHSRGGLVVSWWLRLRPTRVERAVFVGAPLVGTSLAAPDRLRAALDLLANYADAVSAAGQAASSVMPLAAGAAGLAKVLGRALRLGSGVPMLDAAVALVPGLATQQAVANNLELHQLFADRWLGQARMSAIGVSFEPDESRQPMWRFWKRFTNVRGQLKYAAADLVFPGTNDLVVDVASMFQLGEDATVEFDDLGASATTHHTRYFRDPAVLSRLGVRLRG